MLALSGLCEGFARGVVYLHAACPERSAVFASRVLHRGRRAHLPVPKSLAAKSSVSVSSKLIEIKGLQLQHFGHLRKTGGRGSYRLVHTAHLPVPKSLAAKSNYSGHPTKDVHAEPAEGLFSYSSIPVGQHRAISIQPAHYSAKSNYSRTYAIPRGWGVFPGPTFKSYLKCLHAGCVECRRADIFDFSPDFSHFSCPGRGRRACPESAEGSPLPSSAILWTGGLSHCEHHLCTYPRRQARFQLQCRARRLTTPGPGTHPRRAPRLARQRHVRHGDEPPFAGI